MKVMREKESFKPVTIILESQEELDWLFCCLAGTNITDANKTYAYHIKGTDSRRFTKLDTGSIMYKAVRKIVEEE